MSKKVMGMSRHKHSWNVIAINVLPIVRKIEVVWGCKCRGTRTEEIKPRKPANTALTDTERAERDQARKMNKVKPSMAGWPEEADFLGRPA
jgi:hypothetical protein